MWERTHIAGALHIVLSAQGIHAHALAPNIAGEHGQIGNAHDRSRALRVFGHTQPVVNRRIATGGVQTCSLAQGVGGHARDVRDGFGRIVRVADELFPELERCGVTALRHKRAIVQAFGHNDVCQSIDHRDICPRSQLNMMFRLDLRRLNQFNFTRVNHDQACTLAQTLFQARAKHGMRIGRIRPNDHNDVGLLNRFEGLRPCRCAKRLTQAVASRRMAHARAGIDVVRTQHSAHEFLHQIGFLIGATRGGNAAECIFTVLRLNRAEFVHHIGNRRVP